MQKTACSIVLIAATALGSQASASEDSPKLVGTLGQYLGSVNYPPKALLAGEQGRSVAKIDIDRAGKPFACTIEVSSGSAELDKATCKLAQRMRLTPASDGQGRPIASVYRFPMRWTLPASAQRPPVN